MRRFCLAIAVGKIANFGPRKVALKIIFRLREKNLYVKADPSQQLYLGRKGFYEVFKILKVLNFLRELKQKYGKGKEGGGVKNFWEVDADGGKVGKLLRKIYHNPQLAPWEGKKVRKRADRGGRP